MSEITPIEFERDNYRDKVANGECIVWYKNEYPVQWVRRQGSKQNDYYELHHDDGGDYSRIDDVGSYEVCLKVEDTTDKDALRQRCFEIARQVVEGHDTNELIGLRIGLQRDIQSIAYTRWITAQLEDKPLTAEELKATDEP